MSKEEILEKVSNIFFETCEGGFDCNRLDIVRKSLVTLMKELMEDLYSCKKN